MNYSGSANFEFEIERYKNTISGELLTLEEGSDDNCFLEYQTIPLRISGRSFYTAGRSYGEPEDCFPCEGESEIDSVIGPDGKDWAHLLTKSETATILDLIEENVSEGSGHDYDYYDDNEPYYDDEPDVDYDDY